MRLPSQSLAISAACSLLVVSAQPVQAARATADKELFEPLRQLDLAALIDGSAGLPDGFDAAYQKLPSSCRELPAQSPGECDDQVRCGWLGARVQAARAFREGGHDARWRSAEGLFRSADRLIAGGRCGRDPESYARWQSDRQQAAKDAGHAFLALLAGDPQLDLDGPDVVAVAESRRVAEAVRRARAQGVSQLATVDVASDRALYRSVWMRRVWLGRLPALAAMRELLAASYGSRLIPPNCGAELMQNDLLDDQWRGFLVREAIPAAIDCLMQGSPRLGMQGAARSPQAASLAARIKAAARRDQGGRDFAADPAQAALVRDLRAALTSGGETPQRAQAHPAPARARNTPAAWAPAETTRASRGDTNRATAARPALTTSKSDIDSNDLVRLAGLVGEIVGDPDGMHLSAKRAKTPQLRIQLLASLLVELHRAVCAPLAELDIVDLDAARRVLASRGHRFKEQACHGSAGSIEDLRTLLKETSALRRLHAAASIRTAAGWVSMQRSTDAIALLDRLDPVWRGDAWSLVRAWAERERGDHVAASRALAYVTPERLAELRSSGDPQLNRLIAHAGTAR